MQARGTIGLVVILVLGGLLAWQMGWLGDPGADEEPDLLDGEYVGPGDSSSRDGPQLAADGSRTLPATKTKRARGDAAGAAGASGRAASPGAEIPAPPTGTDRIVGVVTDAAGNPITGATVRVAPSGAALLADGRVEGAVSVQADEQGRFLFVAPKAGSYSVSVSADGYMGAGRTTMRGGEPVRLALDKAVPLAGLLREKGSGAAVARFSIFAMAVEAGVTGTRHLGQTDDEGRFEFLLPEGVAHFVQYPSSNYSVWGTTGDWIHARWGPFEAGREDLELEIQRGLSIAGTVVDASGAELDELFRVEVLGRTPRGDVDYSRRRFATTDKKGAFRVNGLPEGLYLVTAKPLAAADGKAPSGLTAVEIEGIAAGTLDLVLELSRGEPMVGEIVDGEGEPVTGKGYVHVFPQGSTAGSPDSMHGTLDLKGGFKTPPLDPGTAYDLLIAGFEGYAQVRVEGAHAGAAIVRVTLEKAGLIKGRVVRTDGKPVSSGLAVLATAIGVKPGAKGGHGYAYPDQLGRFTLNGLGDYTFRLSGGGARSGLVADGFTHGVKPGATDVEVKVKPGVALSGTLVDANGDPVKTHMLTAMPVGAEASSPGAWTSIPGDDGRFHFAGVHPGKLRILARLGGKSVVVGEVTAPATDVVLTVPAD